MRSSVNVISFFHENFTWGKRWKTTTNDGWILLWICWGLTMLVRRRWTRRVCTTRKIFPRKLTWNLKIERWKRRFTSTSQSSLGFHIPFRGVYVFLCRPRPHFGACRKVACFTDFPRGITHCCGGCLSTTWEFWLQRNVLKDRSCDVFWVICFPRKKNHPGKWEKVFFWDNPKGTRLSLASCHTELRNLQVSIAAALGRPSNSAQFRIEAADPFLIFHGVDTWEVRRSKVVCNKNSYHVQIRSLWDNQEIGGDVQDFPVVTISCSGSVPLKHIKTQ